PPARVFCPSPVFFFFFFQAEDGIRDRNVTGVQTCALPIYTPYTALLFQKYIFFLRRQRFLKMVPETVKAFDPLRIFHLMFRQISDHFAPRHLRESPFLFHLSA